LKILPNQPEKDGAEDQDKKVESQGLTKRQEEKQDWGEKGN
jgi:hypothetical protein